MSDRIEIDYERMEDIKGEFADRAEQASEIIKIVRSAVDQLRSNGWTGPHADKFYAEMDRRLLVALADLKSALDISGEAVGKIMKKFEEGEEEARKRIKSDF
jgi:WXG100 family type VII secretion target